MRASGGYVVLWAASGFPIISDMPFAPWPEWLLSQAMPTQISLSHSVINPKKISSGYIRASLRNAVRKIATAQEGTRNDTLNTEAYSIFRFVVSNQLSADHAAESLAYAALAAGLSPSEIEKTLISAMRARGLK